MGYQLLPELKQELHKARNALQGQRSSAASSPVPAYGLTGSPVGKGKLQMELGLVTLLAYTVGV